MRSNARSIMRRDAAAAVTLARGHEGRCDAGFLDFFKVTKPNENGASARAIRARHRVASRAALEAVRNHD